MSSSPEPVSQPTWLPKVVLGLILLANVLAGYLLTMRSVDYFGVPSPGGVVATSHIYPERVALAGVAWLTALGAAIALPLLLLKRQVTRVWWIALMIGTLISINAALVISAMPRPLY